MKKPRCLCFIAMFVLALSVLVTPVAAQRVGPYEVQSLTIGSGENAVTSGIAGTIRLAPADSSRFLEFTAQQQQAWVICGPRFGSSTNILTAASVGYFQGAPWAGPFINLEIPVATVAGQQITFSTLQWPAFFAWEPNDKRYDGKPNPEKVLLGYFANARLNIGAIELSFAMLNFLDEPWNKLPGISYAAKVLDNLKILSSVTWNNNKNRWLLYMGIQWTPN